MYLGNLGVVTVKSGTITARINKSRLLGVVMFLATEISLILTYILIKS